MSCRHYCIEFLKKSFSKTFLFHKIIYKYFAGFLACINKLFKSFAETTVRLWRGVQKERAVRRSNPLSTDCHASCQWHAYGVEARNDAIICSHYEGNARSNLFNGLLRIRQRRTVVENARNDMESKSRNDAVIYSHYERKRSNLFSGLLRIGNARNDNKIKACINAICSDYKNFQFDKFQRLLSVIYKKIHLKGDLHHVKSKSDF